MNQSVCQERNLGDLLYANVNSSGGVYQCFKCAGTANVDTDNTDFFYYFQGKTESGISSAKTVGIFFAIFVVSSIIIAVAGSYSGNGKILKMKKKVSRVVVADFFVGVSIRAFIQQRRHSMNSLTKPKNLD